MNNFAQRAFHIGTTNFAKNADLSELPADQLKTFQDVGLAGPKIVEQEAPTEAEPANTDGSGKSSKAKA